MKERPTTLLGTTVLCKLYSTPNERGYAFGCWRSKLSGPLLRQREEPFSSGPLDQSIWRVESIYRQNCLSTWSI